MIKRISTKFWVTYPPLRQQTGCLSDRVKYKSEVAPIIETGV